MTINCIDTQAEILWKPEHIVPPLALHFSRWIYCLESIISNLLQSRQEWKRRFLSRRRWGEGSTRTLWVQLDTSGNKCTKPDPRYPTLIECQGSKTLVNCCSIFCAPFSAWALSFFSMRVLKISADQLLGIFPQTKLDIVRQLASPYWVNPTLTRSCFQLTYPNTRTGTKFFSWFYL